MDKALVQGKKNGGIGDMNWKDKMEEMISMKDLLVVEALVDIVDGCVDSIYYWVDLVNYHGWAREDEINTCIRDYSLRDDVSWSCNSISYGDGAEGCPDGEYLIQVVLRWNVEDRDGYYSMEHATLNFERTFLQRERQEKLDQFGDDLDFFGDFFDLVSKDVMKVPLDSWKAMGMDLWGIEIDAVLGVRVGKEARNGYLEMEVSVAGEHRWIDVDSDAYCSYSYDDEVVDNEVVLMFKRKVRMRKSLRDRWSYRKAFPELTDAMIDGASYKKITSHQTNTWSSVIKR